MKHLILSFCLLAFITAEAAPLSTFDWGRNGHRTTAQIAQNHLKGRAERKINKILKGKSLALISTFGDDIKSDSRYLKYSKWHYINIPAGKNYADVKDSIGENLIWAVRECETKLKDKKTSSENQRFYLKMLVHLIGDLHQPLHVGHGYDRGGNDIKLEWFGGQTNLHRVWDSDMIDSYKMSYTELAENEQQLTKKQRQAIQSGTLLDWIKESQVLAEKVYASVEEGDHLKYKYMYNWFPVVREQLQKGGVRLAEILNEIYA